MATKPKAKATAKKKSTPNLASKKKSIALAPSANTTGFELFSFSEIPAVKRAGGGSPSPYPFASMQEGQGFFVSAQIDTSKFTDATEAAKAQQEQCQTVSNRLSGAVRRFTKKHDGYKFAVRTTQNAAEEWGVWVGRVAIEAKA